METEPLVETSTSEQPSTSKCNYRLPDTDSVVSEKFSGKNDDIAINGVVARVHVDQFNFDEFFTNKTRPLPEETENRGIKRKLSETKQENFVSSETDNSGVEIKIRKRGRPRKLKPINLDNSEVTDESNVESTPLKGTKRRGRPRKINVLEKTNNTESDLESKISKLGVKFGEKQRRFNGSDSSSGHISSSRIIKPNSRLQDFVVSSNVRYYAQSTKIKPTVKEESTVVKERFLKRVSQAMDEDPLNIANDSSDDTVRSFLPVFDDSQQSDESEAGEELNKSDDRITEKENQVNNLQPKISKNPARPKCFKTDEYNCSSSKPRGKNDSKTEFLTKSGKNIIKNNVRLGQQKPQTPLVKASSAIDEEYGMSDFAKGDVMPGKSKPETKMNGSSSTLKQGKRAVKYVLVDSDGARNRNKTPKVGDVDFNKLVRSLKLVKLPGANWKIRIVVSKQQTITEVTFTNKEAHERCIKFSRTIAGYVVTFGKSVVKLLGAPTKISSFNDVSVLLDIVHNISPADPILEYNTSNVV